MPRGSSTGMRPRRGTPCRSPAGGRAVLPSRAPRRSWRNSTGGGQARRHPPPRTSSRYSATAKTKGAEYRPPAGQLSEHDTALIGQVVARHFAPERLYAVIRDDFRRRVDQKELDAMAVWFRSPIGRRITALEIAASRPEVAPKIEAFAAGLKTSPAPASRLELVQRLDWVTGTSHEATELGLSIAGSVA